MPRSLVFVCRIGVVSACSLIGYGVSTLQAYRSLSLAAVASLVLTSGSLPAENPGNTDNGLEICYATKRWAECYAMSHEIDVAGGSTKNIYDDLFETGKSKGNFWIWAPSAGELM